VIVIVIGAAEVDIRKLFIGKLNVRHEAGDISELAASIKRNGVLHPIVVRPAGKRFEVIVGSRRLAAARMLGMKKLPAIIRPLKETEALVESLVENIERGDLDVVEEGEAYETLVGKLGGAREVERQTGIGNVRISEGLEALDAARKLKSSGIKVTARLPSNAGERVAGNALPKQHAVELERTFRSGDVAKLPARERQKKYGELARAIAPLPQVEARRLLDEFRKYPERNITEIEQRVSTKLTGIALETYLPPGLARQLDQVAEENKTSVEEVLPDILERGLSSSAHQIKQDRVDDTTVVTEIDTGYAFTCPVCKGKFRILHNKPTNVHRFEEMD
jgi:ParB/RepB/Spo0J family partition protein